MNVSNTSSGSISNLRNKIISYYDETKLEYRVLWINRKNRALHFGFFEEGIKNHDSALVNLNKVMAKKANIISLDSVLDAGCGQGGSAFWLAENIGCKVVGITIVPHQVKKAQEYCDKRRLANLISFEEKDYCNTGFADGSFSVVWACESLCHSEDKMKFYKEAFRLLKRGGRLIVAEYIRSGRDLGTEKENILNQWCSGWSMPDLDTWQEHKDNMTKIGFADIAEEDVTPNLETSLRRLHKVSTKLLNFGKLLHYVKIRNRIKHENHIASISQYEALKQKSWYYSIFSAQKPN